MLLGGGRGRSQNVLANRRLPFLGRNRQGLILRVEKVQEFLRLMKSTQQHALGAPFLDDRDQFHWRQLTGDYSLRGPDSELRGYKALRAIGIHRVVGKHPRVGRRFGEPSGITCADAGFRRPLRIGSSKALAASKRMHAKLMAVLIVLSPISSIERAATQAIAG